MHYWFCSSHSDHVCLHHQQNLTENCASHPRILVLSKAMEKLGLKAFGLSLITNHRVTQKLNTWTLKKLWKWAIFQLKWLSNSQTFLQQLFLMSSRNASQITKINYRSVSHFFHVSNIYERILHDNMRILITFRVDLEGTLVRSTASYTCWNIASIYDNRFVFAAVITELWRTLDWIYFFLNY